MNRSDGREHAYSICFWSKKFGFDSNSGQPVILKLVFTASLFDAQHSRDNVENKPGGLFVVPLERALNGVLYYRVVVKWPVTLNRGRYSALIAFW